MARYITNPLAVWFYYDTPAGGETATTTMGDTTNGEHGNTAADTPNPEAGDHSTTNNPFADLARALYTTTINTTHTGKGTGEDRLELEVVEDDMPILAHRAALLRFDGTDRYWQSISLVNSSFGVDCDAKCQNVSWTFYTSFGFYADDPTPSHAVPDVNCGCGFYAVPLGAPPYSQDRRYVTLLVELSGDVIECDKLYRAGHQRVVECQLPRCAYCGAPSQVFRVRDGALAESACSKRHLEVRKGVHLTFDDIAGLLPVPVTHVPEPG